MGGLLLGIKAMSWYEKNKKWLIPLVIVLILLILVGFIVSSVMCSQASASTEDFSNIPIRDIKSRADKEKEHRNMQMQI
jgi:uncharacterized membrane protein